MLPLLRLLLRLRASIVCWVKEVDSTPRGAVSWHASIQIMIIAMTVILGMIDILRLQVSGKWLLLEGIKDSVQGGLKSYHLGLHYLYPRQNTNIYSTSEKKDMSNFYTYEVLSLKTGYTLN